MIGAPANRELPISPFEFWFTAEGPYNEGDYRRAIEIVSESLTHWPDHPTMLYQLSCYYALAGEGDEAIAFLERAAAQSPDVVEWARGDSDLDSIRGQARFTDLVGAQTISSNASARRPVAIGETKPRGHGNQRVSVGRLTPRRRLDGPLIVVGGTRRPASLSPVDEHAHLADAEFVFRRLQGAAAMAFGGLAALIAPRPRLVGRT